MLIREAEENDYGRLMRLYLHLHEDRAPALDGRMARVWSRILQDPDHHLVVCEEDGELVSSCACVIVPNLTRNGRPYALIENVVTHPAYRRRGLASMCLEHARGIALREGCYKIMLMTGSREAATHRFYQRAGYSNTEKTAYIQRLD